MDWNAERPTGTGFAGLVTLVSPAGETIRRRAPGRDPADEGAPPSHQGGELLGVRPMPHLVQCGGWHHASWYERIPAAEVQKKDRRISGLLARGWKVVTGKETATTGGGGKAGGAGEGTTTERPTRGKRGGGRRGERGGGRKAAENTGSGVRVSQARKGKGISIAPQTPAPAKEVLQSARRSAELLKELVGRAAQRTHQGTAPKTLELLMALETGDNPIPLIEAPRERPTARVLVTPDCSGSTQDWSGLGSAWAHLLEGDPELEVTFVANFNGNILRADWMGRPEGSTELTLEEAMSLLGKFDLVIYLGDGDGLELCRAYAARGVTAIALDCYAAREAAPRVSLKNSVRRNGSGGQLCWVEKCSAKEPLTWQKALQLALRQLE